MARRGITFDRRVHPGNYDVLTAAGTTLGSVQRQSKGWAASDPMGQPLPEPFASRAAAGEALFQASEDRFRAARDEDLGRTTTTEYVNEGWWHPNTKDGRVHDHPANPGGGWSTASHRLCQPVYTRRDVIQPHQRAGIEQVLATEHPVIR